MAKDLSGLDRGTVAAARAAGIPEESLKENPIPEALDEDDGGGILVECLEEPE